MYSDLSKQESIFSAIRKELSRRATGLSDEIRNKMKDAEKTLEEHKSDQKAINAGNQ